MTATDAPAAGPNPLPGRPRPLDPFPEPLTFRALGTPVPQGAIRSLGKGRPSIHANADNLLPWRNHVQIEAQRARGQRPPWDGPVAVSLTFTVAKPASAPKRRRTWPTKRPDLDKLIRGVLDAITAAGVWKDDSQVVTLTASKNFPGDPQDRLGVPGVYAHVEPMQ